MSIPDWMDTTNIESKFVVANTPNFIVRRIKEDKAAYLLSQSLSADALLKMFIESAGKEPQTLRDLVTPYICLSALSLKPDVKYLRDAITFTARPQYKWLRACAQILIDTFRPTSFVKVDARPLDNSVFVKSSSTVNYTTVDLSRP
jgi:hypothetical protein